MNPNDRRRHRVWGILAACLLLLGCRSPEDGRLRGGGAGGDGGNYDARPIHAPSKIDATKPLPADDP